MSEPPAKLSEEQIQAALAALQRNPGALEALLAGSGAIVQSGGTAAGAGGVAVGGNVQIVLNLTEERLAALWGKPALSDDALREATRQYFEFLVDRHQYLDFRGMGVSGVALKLPLLGVYIPGRARVETPSGDSWERVRIAGRPASEEEAAAMGRRLSEAKPLLELQADCSALVVLGDPGAGKTTFLKYLTLSVALGKGDELGLGERLPILLPLSAYANQLAEKDVPLLEFAAAHPTGCGLALPLSDLLDRALAQGKALLLLDGLDEVRDSRLRRVVVDRLQDFCSRYRRAGNRLVLTSRIVGYREVRPTGDGWQEATLVDFEEEEIEEFVTRWTSGLEQAARGEGAAGVDAAQREQEELLHAVRHSEGVRSLAANPLLLTILALMKRQGVTLPERRVQLYQKYVETLIQHWNLARGLDGRAGRELDALETMRVLAPLALWMHETSPGAGLVPEWRVIDQLTAILASRGRAEPEAAARAFLGDVRQHTGLLLDRGGERYGFIHLTFQEYLAAVALAGRGEKELKPLIDELALRVGHPAWREVSRLAIGHLAVVQGRDGAAAEVLEELLSRRPGTAGEVEILAGEAAIDVGVGGLPESSRQKVVAVLLTAMRDDGRVKANERLRCGEVLGRLGDPRPEVMTVDGIWDALCEVPAGGFWMGFGEDDENAEAYEKPRHRVELPYAFRLARYPVTVAQFREYVEESGARPEDEDSLRGPANAPVVWVSWEEALRFCRWLTVRWQGEGRLPQDWVVSLPSEAEWEKAARGKEGRVYPWGNDFDLERANVDEAGWGRVSTVGVYPGGSSAVGCEELAGNVWEWTRSLWGNEWGKPEFGYPYRPKDGREIMSSTSDVLRVVRGGSFDGDFRGARGAVRSGHDPPYRGYDVGFRPVVLPFSSGL